MNNNTPPTTTQHYTTQTESTKRTNSINESILKRPLGPSKRTFFSDRFNLGGPMTLRGFPFYGAGPRAPKEEGGCRGGDALGGDIRYTGTGLSVLRGIDRSRIKAAGGRLALC